MAALGAGAAATGAEGAAWKSSKSSVAKRDPRKPNQSVWRQQGGQAAKQDIPSKLAFLGFPAAVATGAFETGSSSSKSNRLTSFFCGITGVSFLIGAGAAADGLLLLEAAAEEEAPPLGAGTRSSSSPASYSSKESRWELRVADDGYEASG